MICDASSFKISNDFTYNNIRNEQKCNVIIIMNGWYGGGKIKPKYVYETISDDEDRWVSLMEK